MNNQPTLARTVPAPTFFYVQVCGDQADAEAELELYCSKIPARSYQLVHVEPGQEEGECEVCVFVVYAPALPDVEADDMIADLYTMPHLVNAPCYDIDDLT